MRNSSTAISATQTYYFPYFLFCLNISKDALVTSVTLFRRRKKLLKCLAANPSLIKIQEMYECVEYEGESY